MKNMARIMAFFVSVMFAGILFSAEADWRQVKTGEGIVVFTRGVEGSDLDEFKGMGFVDASPEVVNNVLDDISSLSSMVSATVSAVLVEKGRDETRIIYYEIGTPWPLENRDIVFSNTVIRTREVITRKFQAVTHPQYPPRKGKVRMTVMAGQWTLVKKDKGTLASYQVRSNPAGNIPVALANFASRDVPYKTIRALRELVKQPRYQQTGPL